MLSFRERGGLVTSKKPESFSIRIADGSAGRAVFRGRELTVVRGELRPEYFRHVCIPDYQREAMRHHKHFDLMEVLAQGGIGVPEDLLLCARDAQFRPFGAGEVQLTVSTLNLLDGHQRFAAATALLKQHEQPMPFGVKIFLNTTKDEEVAGFFQVNRLQTPVSSDVFLRNQQDNAAILALRELEKETEGFPQIGWDQLKRPGDCMRAHTLYEVAILIHGYSQKGRIEDLFEALEEIQEREGTTRLKENVKTFFAALNNSFNTDELRDYMYRADLLRGLAMLFGGYTDFWDTKQTKLVVRKEKTNKLRTISRRAMDRILETKSSVNVERSLRQHIDKGRRRGSGLTPLHRED